jgi:hypothetical protein
MLASAEGARALIAAGVGKLERLPGQPAAALLLRLAQEKIHVDCEVLEEEKQT